MNDKVDVDVEMPDSTFLILAKRAHELDITFNQLVEKIIQENFINAKK